MAFLTIDTSSTFCAVHLRGDDERIYQKSEEIGRGHAEYIIPMIDEALAALDLAYKDISAIGVTVGPGNFTGVRVGLSVARGLGVALKCPVIGVSALEAMGFSISGRRLVVFDAKRSEVYAELLDSSGDEAHSLGGPQLIDVTLPLPQSWFESSPLLLLGNGVSQVIDSFDKKNTKTNIINENSAPNIVDVATIARTRFLEGKSADFPPKPLYLRAPDAKPQTSAGLFVRSA